MKFKLLSVVFLNKNILKNESVDKFPYFTSSTTHACFKTRYRSTFKLLQTTFKKNEAKDSFMNHKYKCFYVEFYFLDGKC